MDKLPIFDPTTPPKEQTIRYAPRPGSLQNLRIGLIENTKHNSDQLLLRIAAILEKEYGAKSHLLRSKRSAGVPVEEAVIREMADHWDIAIAGIGD